MEVTDLDPGRCEPAGVGDSLIAKGVMADGEHDGGGEPGWHCSGQINARILGRGPREIVQVAPLEPGPGREGPVDEFLRGRCRQAWIDARVDKHLAGEARVAGEVPCDNRSEIAARAIASDHDPLAEVKQGLGYGDRVVDGCGERVLRCESVVDVHDPPSGDIAGRARNWIGGIDIAEHPSATVEPYERGLR